MQCSVNCNDLVLLGVVLVLTLPEEILSAGVSGLGEVGPHRGQFERHLQVFVVERIVRLPEGIPHEVELVRVSHPGTVVVVEPWGVDPVVLALQQ